MTTQETFIEQMGNLKKKAIRRSIERIIADAFIFSLFLGVGAITAQKAGWIAGEKYRIYLLLVLLSIFVSALIEIRKRKGFFDELIAIDLRFQLKEMLSSAYECLKGGRKSMLVELLIEDASRLLGRIRPEQLLPIRLFRRYILIPVLALVMVFALTIDFLPARTEPNRESNMILDQIAISMKRLSKEERNPSEKDMKKGRNSLFKEMEELERNLRNRSMNTQKALKSLRDFIGETQKAQSSLAGQIVEELSIQNIEAIPSFKPELKRGIPLKNLEMAETLFEKFFEGEIPATLTEKISDLKRYNEIQQFLAKTMDAIESDLKSDSKQESRGGLKRDESPEMTKNASSRHVGREKTGSSTRDGVEDPDQKQSFAAGRGKDSHGKGPFQKIIDSKNAPVKDPTSDGPGMKYSVHIRSLPVVERAGIKPEDLIRSYRNEIEEVLTNEKIPVNYREYIKNYFLSIGVEQEEYE